MNQPTSQIPSSPESEQRRTFLSATGLAMTTGLAAGYGSFAAILGQFLYPAESPRRAWLFVCLVEELLPGEGRDFVSPSGQRIVVARHGKGTTEADFLALSSVCPHLGCRVHWEPQHDRFFCPCHNGVFDRSGKATAGPPAAAGQNLVRFPVKVDRGMLLIEAPVDGVPLASLGAAGGPNACPFEAAGGADPGSIQIDSRPVS
jgi:cytochrome b6-f complex iron-sulfur subunit